MDEVVDTVFRVVQPYNTNVVLPNETDGLPWIEHGEVWTPPVVQRVSTLLALIAFTLMGNVCIIIVLTCSKHRRLQSRVNIFIVNLAVGDLTVCCVTMTTEMIFVVFEKAWMLGAVACKLLLYAQIVTLASTTFILTAMSIDRYMAICCPLRFSTRGSRARRMVAVAWAAAAAFALPQLMIFKQVAVGRYVDDGDIKYICASRGYSAGWWQRKLYFSFMATYILILPTCIISFCYVNVVRIVWQQGRNVIAVTSSSTNGRAGSDNASEQLRRSSPGASRRIPRAKVRSVKMTLSIIVSFIACWTPYFVVHLVHIWSNYEVKIAESVYVFAETAALLNSALNPLIYGFWNIKMRSGLLEVFCKRRNKQPPNTLRQSVSGGPGAGDSTATECITIAKPKRFILSRAAFGRGSPHSPQRWQNCHCKAKTQLCYAGHCVQSPLHCAPEKLERKTTMM